MQYHDNVDVNVALSSTDLSVLLAIPPAHREIVVAQVQQKW